MSGFERWKNAKWKIIPNILNFHFYVQCILKKKPYNVKNRCRVKNVIKRKWVSPWLVK